MFWRLGDNRQVLREGHPAAARLPACLAGAQPCGRPAEAPARRPPAPLQHYCERRAQHCGRALFIHPIHGHHQLPHNPAPDLRAALGHVQRARGGNVRRSAVCGGHAGGGAALPVWPGGGLLVHRLLVSFFCLALLPRVVAKSRPRSNLLCPAEPAGWCGLRGTPASSSGSSSTSTSPWCARSGRRARTRRARCARVHILTPCAPSLPRPTSPSLASVAGGGAWAGSAPCPSCLRTLGAPAARSRGLGLWSAAPATAQHSLPLQCLCASRPRCRWPTSSAPSSSGSGTCCRAS